MAVMTFGHFETCGRCHSAVCGCSSLFAAITPEALQRARESISRAGLLPEPDENYRDALATAQRKADETGEPVLLRVLVMLGDDIATTTEQWVQPMAAILSAAEQGE